MKKNCWEQIECGREPGGKAVEKLGVCPAATEQRLNGKNSGKNGGRACWVIAGSFCEGKVQGVHLEKVEHCMSCDFFWKVKEEEGDSYVSPTDLVELLF